MELQLGILKALCYSHAKFNSLHGVMVAYVSKNVLTFVKVQNARVATMSVYMHLILYLCFAN